MPGRLLRYLNLTEEPGATRWPRHLLLQHLLGPIIPSVRSTEQGVVEALQFDFGGTEKVIGTPWKKVNYLWKSWTPDLGLLHHSVVVWPRSQQTHAVWTILNPWLRTGLATYSIAPSPSLQSWWPISKLTTFLYELQGKKDKNNQPTPYHVPQFQRTRKKNKQQEKFRLKLEQLSNKWTTAQTVPKGLSPHTSDLTCFASPGDWGVGCVEHSFLWYVEPWAQRG